MRLLLGDCLDKLKELEDNSVDSIVTDPPYGLSFMGKKWDYDVPSVEIWQECLRVLKPGGHLLSFAGSRTYHRMAVRIEDAGFEIRDQIMWIYGSGFPKSHNIGKAVDKLEGNSDWEGWGTALKPAHEPIVMARKPLIGTVADNVLEYGVGGINIDGCRVGTEKVSTHSNGVGNTGDKGIYGTFGNQLGSEEREGRFPANIILDEEAGKILDEQSGERKGWADQKHNSFNPYGGNSLNQSNTQRDGIHKGYNDNGGASRFFYCPKASKSDRDEGLTTEAKVIKGRDEGQDKMAVAYKARPTERKNIHPTVKPTDLMAYLIRLVTPKGGVVLDPFMGSGSTGKAAVLEGMDFIGIEREEEYYEISKQRIENETNKRKFW
jgi:site-specific DNA-methyltransferase (adenine-specific)